MTGGVGGLPLADMAAVQAIEQASGDDSGTPGPSAPDDSGQMQLPMAMPAAAAGNPMKRATDHIKRQEHSYRIGPKGKGQKK